MSIPEILEAYPKTRDVFHRYGLFPEGYKTIEYEDLSATARVHQIDLIAILTDLNEAIA